MPAVIHAFTTMETGKYNGTLFLSYNSKDREFVDMVRTRLKARGVLTFFDRSNLPKGVPWMPEVSKALEHSNAVAVFIGPHGLGDYQDREVQMALDRQVRVSKEQTNFSVVAVLMAG